MSQQLDQNLMKVDGSTDFECSRKETVSLDIFYIIYCIFKINHIMADF